MAKNRNNCIFNILLIFIVLEMGKPQNAGNCLNLLTISNSTLVTDDVQQNSQKEHEMVKLDPKISGDKLIQDKFTDVQTLDSGVGASSSSPKPLLDNTKQTFSYSNTQLFWTIWSVLFSICLLPCICIACCYTAGVVNQNQFSI